MTPWTRSQKKIWPLKLVGSYHNTCGHKTWHGGDIPSTVSTHKVTWSFNNHMVLWGHVKYEIPHISICTTTLTIKQGKVVTQREGLPSINSQISLIMCLCQVTWQTKKYLHYHNPYGHNTYQGGCILPGASTHKFTKLLNKINDKKTIKHGKVVASDILKFSKNLTWKHANQEKNMILQRFCPNQVY